MRGIKFGVGGTMLPLLKNLTFAVPVFIATLLTGCSTVDRLQPTVTVNSKNDSYFVIGMSTIHEPDDAIMPTHAMINTVTVTNGVSVPDGWIGTQMIPFLNYAEDGYVVGKALHPGDTLDVNEAGPVVGHGTITTLFTPCGKTKTMVFKVPGGKVTYIGDLKLRLWDASDNLEVSYSSDIDAARRFLRSHYPSLADHLEAGTYELMPCEHKPD